MKNMHLLFLVLLLCSSFSYALLKGDDLKLPIEARRTKTLEQARERIQFCLENIGNKFTEKDVFQMGEPGEYEAGQLITYGVIGAIYWSSGNHFKAAEYDAKDYHEYQKVQTGQPAIWAATSGDSEPFGNLIITLVGSQMYPEADKYYEEQNDFYWMHIPKGTLKEKKRWLAQNEDYMRFVKEWRNVKELAKTIKPKPLSIQVEMHNNFYSSKPEEVLKALGYYYQNKVNFMLEKALKHKDPVIAAKAKEYLEKFSEADKK